MDITKIATMLMGFVGSMAGAGPWGLGAIGVGLAALFFGIQYAIRNFNSKVDAGDQANAGSDAGSTASELQNQTQEVTGQLDVVGNLHPAIDPDAKVIKK
jgi:hypothetical protein